MIATFTYCPFNLRAVYYCYSPFTRQSSFLQDPVFYRIPFDGECVYMLAFTRASRMRDPAKNRSGRIVPFGFVTRNWIRSPVKSGIPFNHTYISIAIFTRLPACGFLLDTVFSGIVEWWQPPPRARRVTRTCVALAHCSFARRRDCCVSSKNVANKY